MVSAYQHAAAYDSGHLPVGSIHKVYYEQYGKQDGKPVIFLHGGPGGNTSPSNTSFFDPAIYRVVLLDQRGCGKSTPHADLRENDSQHLVADIQALRQHLKVPKWHMVFGGSWGSALGLMYAEAHPEAVGSLVLRGIFTLRHIELDHAFNPEKGPAMLYPEAFNKWLDHVGPEHRSDPVRQYHRLIAQDDPDVWRPACKAWNAWETSISKVNVPDEDFDKFEDDQWLLAHARMELHYFVNGGFVEEGQLLREENVERIKHIPCEAVPQNTL